jgi:hypothetical protein
MPITEHQLQAISLRIHFDHLNPSINHRRRPAQSECPALRTRALATQLDVVQPLFATIRPVQA